MRAPSITRLAQIAGRSRGPVLGMASQLLNAGTNVVTAYVASLLLRPEEFGTFVIAFAAVAIVLATERGLVGSTMMVHLPAQDGTHRAILVRSALGFTLLTGVAASLLLVLAGFVHPVMWAFAPWITVTLLQDVGRYVLLSTGRTGQALATDVAWASVQGLVLLGGLALGAVSLGLVAAAWGLGALAGLALFIALTHSLPGHPRPWVHATRDVAGWFTAVAIVGQVEIYLVLLLTGILLGSGEVGGLRTVQLLAYQPPVVLLAALLTVMQPVVVRARHSPTGLYTAWRHITVAVAPVLVGLILLGLLRGPLMGLLFPQYVGYAPLVWPIALQSAFVALGVAPLAVLNGLRQGSRVFVNQMLRTAVLAGAATLGMVLGGAGGVAWALAVGSGLAYVQAVVLARKAIARVPPVTPLSPVPRADVTSS